MLIQFFSLIFLLHASLLIHYKFWTSLDQTFHDYSGNGNDAVNGDTTGAESFDAIPTERGLYMDGSRVRLPPNEKKPGGFSIGTQLSMTCWMKFFDQDLTIFARGYAVTPTLLWMNSPATGYRVYMDTATGSQYIQFLSTITLNNWEFLKVIMNLNGSSLSISMPDFPSSFVSLTGLNYVDSPTTPTYLGRPLRGVIYEFRLYDHLLSPDEYSPLYVSPGSGGCLCAVSCATEPGVICLSTCGSAALVLDSSCTCSHGSTLNTVTGNCQGCALTCKACLNLGDDDCTSCYPNAELAGAAPSKCKCSDGLFPDPTSNHCSACFPNCLTCVSKEATGCLSCFDFADLSEPSPSSCKCTSGYFESANRCLPCNDSCETCKTANECTTCKPGASIASSLPAFCNCNPGFFLEEKSCLPCLDICATCLDATTCITCKANAKLKDSICVCIDGFVGSAASCQAGGSPSECRADQVRLNGACMDSCPIGQKPNDSQICESVAIPTASLTVTAENNLIAEFSKPMECEVTPNDVSVEATASDKTTIDCSVLEANFTDPQTLLITLAYVSGYIPSDSTATLLFFFPEKITDRDTLAISQDSYTVSLNPKGDPPQTIAPMLQTPIAQQTAAVAKGAASTGMALSVLNSSPASLIASVNLFQLIAYVPLASIPLPAGFASSLAALNVGQMIPNPLVADLSRNDTSQLPSRMKDFGIETSLFLPNIASFGSVSVLILLSYVPIWLLSRSNLPVISLYFSNLFYGFKWNTPIALCIVLYLDVGFYSFLQVLHSSTESLYIFVNTCLSYVFCSVFLSVPIGLLVFFCRNYGRLTSVEGNIYFEQRWKILIQPFKRKYEGVIYYFLFAARRVLIVLLLHFGTSKISALCNVLFSIMVRLSQLLLYVFFRRPFSSLLDYLESLFVESCTAIVFLLTAICLADLSDDTQRNLEQCGLWVIKCVMVGSIVSPVVRLIAGIVAAFNVYHKKVAQIAAQQKKSVHDK